MDNICHTLVGAAIGEAGLKRRTALGNATLMIAANLPDVDVLVFATDTPPVAFRRGWTHGVVAQALLPIALAAVMAGVARLRQARRSKAGHPSEPVSVLWLLALGYIGVYSHVALDFLNNYGVRLLSPIDWRWFYGDAVFIIDLWLWIVLGLGVYLTRRTGRPAAARGALAFTVCYVALMLGAARSARPLVADAWQTTRGVRPAALMVGPLPITPFRREVIVDAGDHYERGALSWQDGGRVTFAPGTVPKNADHPAVAAARTAPRIRAFLVWSRFPYWQIEPATNGAQRVTVKDMRFGDRFSASVVIPDPPKSDSNSSR